MRVAITGGFVVDASGRARDRAAARPAPARHPLLLFQHRTASAPYPLQSPWSAPAVTLTRDDNYRLALVASARCFAYVFQVDASRAVTQLFPNARYTRQSNPLRPDEVYWLPEVSPGSAIRWLHLDESRGVERIYLVATTKPLRDEAAVASRLAGDPEALHRGLREDLKGFLDAGEPRRGGRASTATSCMCSRSIIAEAPRRQIDPSSARPARDRRATPR